MRIRKGLFGVLAAAVLATAVAAQAASNASEAALPRDSARSAAAKEVSKIVMFEAGVSKEARAEAIRQAGGRVVRDLALVGGVEAVFPPVRTRLASFSASTVEGGAEALAKGRRGVAEIELNEEQYWLVQLSPAFGAFPAVGEFLRKGAVGAPAIGQEEAKSEEAGVPWGVTRVNAQAAWGRSRGGRGVRVGVIDTGIDCSHEALKANCKSGFNTAEEGGSPADDHGHGTHVAGTIAAASPEVVGVAPESSVFPIKVLNAQGRGTTANIIKGLEWAVENRMQIVNMSLGGGASEALELAIRKTLEAGIVIVAASGNNPNAGVSAPGRYPGVIAVSASASDDSLAGFSSVGPEVAFIAPGQDVVSTLKGGGTGPKSGTSMATPHVAGLAALAIAMGKQGPAAVRQALTRAAKPLEGLEGPQQGAGMIDASRL